MFATAWITAAITKCTRACINLLDPSRSFDLVAVGYWPIWIMLITLKYPCTFSVARKRIAHCELHNTVITNNIVRDGRAQRGKKSWSSHLNEGKNLCRDTRKIYIAPLRFALESTSLDNYDFMFIETRRDDARDAFREPQRRYFLREDAVDISFSLCRIIIVFCARSVSLKSRAEAFSPL